MTRTLLAALALLLAAGTLSACSNDPEARRGASGFYGGAGGGANWR
jgi:uncharacterized lipoprotein